MTATDELRRMLDERGVEWWQSVNMLGCVFTRWYSPLFSDEVVAMENGDGELELFSHLMTPEQAVAATLGSFSCTNGCTNSERTGAPRLPHFWTHDGVLHIEATRMPTRIVVCEGGTCEFVPKRELDASEAENARLREEIEAAKHDLSLFSGELVASKLENAKLRELVKALLTCATDGDCDECRLNGATQWHVGKAQLCDGVWDRMRELGVEVDR